MLLIEERLKISTASGDFGGVLCYPEDTSVRRTVLVSCPHPFLGGTADNPVVRSLCQGLVAGGACALVWEYSSVSGEEGAEKSQGLRQEFLEDHRIKPESSEHLAQATACLGWLESQGCTEGPVALAGYSYGAALSMLLASKHRPAFLISPPLRALPSSWCITEEDLCVILASDDFALSREEIQVLERRSSGKLSHCRVFEQSDHFLLDCLEDVSAEAAAWAHQLD